MKTPIWIMISEYREMTAKRVAISPEEAAARAEAVLDRELAPETENTEIVSRESETEALPNGNLKVTRRIEVIREIGVSLPIREEIPE